MSMAPGAYIVDSFPWLKYLPWYGRELRQGFIEDHTLFHRQLDAVKRHMVRSPHPGPVVDDACIETLFSERSRFGPVASKVPSRARN
jgi:hypothetical protein